MHTQAGSREVCGEGAVGSDERDLVISAGSIGPRREVYEQAFGTAYVSGHRDVHHTQTFHCCRPVW
jgi:hypothetical protein